jgi:hypothetical protein
MTASHRSAQPRLVGKVVAVSLAVFIIIGGIATGVPFRLRRARRLPPESPRYARINPRQGVSVNRAMHHLRSLETSVNPPAT